ncbi:MAG: class I adenylate cyclase [Aestuariibacter sp.]
MDHKQKLQLRLKRVLQFNQLRTERAVSLMPEDKRPLFYVMPFLLHVNHPDLPGYIEDDDTPFGIINFAFKPELTAQLEAIFPDKAELFADIKNIWPKKKALDSLLLMGSIGSIGQSEKSDFDYWVCYNEKRFTQRGVDLLQKKLVKIEHWADAEYDLEVHFFPSEISKVRKNDFGEAGGESAGSAQATFLKSEFYSTNLLVAGKVPFWWVTPSSATDDYYAKMLRFAAKLQKPDPRIFMDLGHLEKVVPSEIFGAAIWQISKAMDSPFKSVLKMAKLEVFIANAEKQQPLCNSLKHRVHGGQQDPEDLKYQDPYAMMFDQVVEYYKSQDKPELVELMQTCLYIKCGCHLSEPVTDGNLTFKRDIISRYITDWGWDVKKLEYLDAIKNWDFQDVSDLGQKIHSFLIGCYRRLSARIQQQEQLVSNQDATVIGRKIDSFYTKKDNKIMYLKRAFDEGLMVTELTVIAKMDLNSPGKKSWSAYRGDVLTWSEQELEPLFLKQSNDPVDLVLWCVFNRIIDSHTKLCLSQKCEPLTNEDFKGFIEQVSFLFPPL